MPISDLPLAGTHLPKALFYNFYCASAIQKANVLAFYNYYCAPAIQEANLLAFYRYQVTQDRMLIAIQGQKLAQEVLLPNLAKLYLEM
jgi:hypothetical protein